MTLTPIFAQSTEISAWLVAALWAFKSAEVVRNLPRVPDLLLLPQILRRETPSLTVIVPARNEQAHVSACVESLLAQDYPNLQILAVDDRSTDQTGPLLTALAAAHPDRLRVLTITELPPDWLGKTHAMAEAAAQSPTDYLLFTDADVLFAPDALSRAIAQTLATHADHFVLAPTPAPSATPSVSVPSTSSSARPISRSAPSKPSAWRSSKTSVSAAASSEPVSPSALPSDEISSASTGPPEPLVLPR